MSFLIKDQWRNWAQEWGLTHVPEKGWVRHTERVLGPRNGLLFLVAWGADEDPGLHVRIRFPRTANLQFIKDALIADPALDALPGRGAGRRKMAIQTGPNKWERLRGRPEFLLTGDSLLWRRTFAFKVPKAATIQAWVDALIGAIRRATPGFTNACEICSTGHARSYVVVDGLPVIMCPACQQRLKADGEMATRTYEMIEVRRMPGTVLAVVAAVIGAVAWAAIGALTHSIYAVAAIGIGALVALAYGRAAGRVDAMGRAIAGTTTLASVVLGEILLYSWWVKLARPDIGFDLGAGWYVYMQTWSKDPGQEIAVMMFGLIGAWVAIRALKKPKLAQSVESADSAEHEVSKAA